MVNYIPVQSSNIALVGYDSDTQTLYVRFLNGSEYSYADVPQDEYDSLVSAASVGSYLNDNIKGVYPHARL